MASRMWRLEEFQYDWDIPGDEVRVADSDSEINDMPKRLAIDLALDQGLHLIPEWPASPDDDGVLCHIAALQLPPRWEYVPSPDTPATLDEELWFVGSCGGRDLLVGNPHTFTGRIAAWCPTNEVGYNVSLSELDDMAVATRYFIKGFLAGNEPAPPIADDGSEDRDDMTAWRSAVARFNRTGRWLNRWRTCVTCGCVLLPDSASERCHEHDEEPHPE